MIRRFFRLLWDIAVFRLVAYLLTMICLIFGDCDGPNLCRVKIVDVLVPHSIENIFRSGLTLVRSNDVITIKIEGKKCYKQQQNKQKIILKNWAVKWTKGKRTQIMRWKKDNFQMFTFLKIF